MARSRPIIAPEDGWAVADSDDCPWPSLPHWSCRMSWSGREVLQFLAAIARLPEHIDCCGMGSSYPFVSRTTNNVKNLKFLSIFV